MFVTFTKRESCLENISVRKESILRVEAINSGLHARITVEDPIDKAWQFETWEDYNDVMELISQAN